MYDSLLVLENGEYFSGKSVGVAGFAVGELIFNTSMTGYQEILTDSSYSEQLITFTTPHIGNTGINDEDMQSSRIWANGVIMRTMSKCFSNHRGQVTLQEYLRQQQIVAIAEIDTRKLTNILREQGNLIGCIVTESDDIDFALQQIELFDDIGHKDLTHNVITAKLQYVKSPHVHEAENKHVIVIDCGVKKSILLQLSNRGCDYTLVPVTINFDDILQLNPDGILISNGPGDPRTCQYLISMTKMIIAKNIPLFAICLGHQLFALACGAKIYKMLFGHHGANHPVYDIKKQRVVITSQNHNYVVSEEQLSCELDITHRSLFDNSIAGLAHKHAPAVSFQGHPEGNPGPQDANDLFKQFLYLMEHNSFKTVRGSNAKTN